MLVIGDVKRKRPGLGGLGARMAPTIMYETQNIIRDTWGINPDIRTVIPTGTVPGTRFPEIAQHIPMRPPPYACAISRARIPNANAAQALEAFDRPAEVLTLLERVNPTAGRATRRALTEWQARYPYATPATLQVVEEEVGPNAGVWLWVLRGYHVEPGSTMRWDPEFWIKRPLRDGTPEAQALQLGMCLFQPSKMVDYVGKNPGTIHLPFTGSLWGIEPIPYWLRIVSEDMVDQAVRFMQAGGFGAVGGGGPSSAQQTAIGVATGAASGATAGPIGIALGAALGFFKSIFGWGDPEPPPWVKRLRVMDEVYAKAYAEGRASQWAQKQETGGSGGGCNVMYVDGKQAFPLHNNPSMPNGRGAYTLIEATAEVSKRLGAPIPSLARKTNWWPIALAAAAAVVLS